MRSSVIVCNVTAGHGVNGAKLWFALTVIKTRLGPVPPAGGFAKHESKLAGPAHWGGLADGGLVDSHSHLKVPKLAGKVGAGLKYTELAIASWIPVMQAALTVGGLATVLMPDWQVGLFLAYSAPMRVAAANA